ncbi:MAG: nuclear transport factor 2 family protein [Sphingomonadaceae bacterium]|nr:nuclear transport factor 2 family protein [Sphingomonadaceae bacterium]
MKILAVVLFLTLLPMVPATPAAGQEPQAYNDAGAATRAIGQSYFDAYIARDWDRLEPLLADSASFRDPTAALVFGGAQADGRAAMMTLFREGYAGITRMAWRPLRAIHSGQYSLFEGELDWALDMGDGRIVASVMPFVTMLQIENGRVVSHRDYGDYTPFLAAAHAARTGSER